MSNNAIGTVLRILFIFISLISIWMITSAIVYIALAYLFDFELSLRTYFISFAVIIIFKIFYPKNVFK
jgi:hypothetical protein